MKVGVGVYCENYECKVETFTITVDEAAAGLRNCPGCGQMGRTKGRESQSSRSIGTEPASDGPQF